MSEVLLRRDERGVRVLTLNRPEKRNALSVALVAALLEALRAADADASVGCILLQAAGPVFCAGVDLGELKALAASGGDGEGHRRQVTLELLLTLSCRLETPLVAAVQGKAVGMGAELAIAADMTILGASASLSYPESRHAMVPTMVLPGLQHRAGAKAAFEVLALAEPMAPERAMSLGLASRVVPDGELADSALATAMALAAVDRSTLRATKGLLREVAGLPLERAFLTARAAGDRLSPSGEPTNPGKGVPS